jgi:hypothetical protein
VLVSVHLMILTVRVSAGICSFDDSEGTFDTKICNIIMWVQLDGTGNHFILLCFICFVLQWKCVTVHVIHVSYCNAVQV